MINFVHLSAMEDEICKIAQGRIDPQMIEHEKILRDKPEVKKSINREAFKEFLKNTGAIAAGTGAGYGLGRLTVDALKKSKKLKGPVKGWRKAVIMGAPVVGGGLAMALRGQMRQEADRRLDDAYQRGLDRGIELRQRVK